MTDIVILGGGYAGVLAANRIAGRLGRDARVTLVSDGVEMVHRIRLHEIVAGRRWRRYPLARLVRRRVGLVHGRAIHVDRGAREVTVVQPTRVVALRWDHLVVATGSRAALQVAGAQAYAGGLSTLPRALETRARLAGLAEGARVVVIGGGLTAIETAAEIAEVHRRVRVTMLADRFAPSLSAKAQGYAREVLGELGVTIRDGVRASAIDGESVALADGGVEPAALTLWAAGFTGRAPFDGDLPLDERGQVVVDATLAVAGGERVWAVGDGAAAPPGLEFLRMGCATAMPMAAHAADNVARAVRGEPPRPFRFGFALQCVSLGRRRGVIQRTDRRDAPTGHVYTGRTGAFIKEAICRVVIAGLRAERRVAGLYFWPRSVPALLPAPTAIAALPPGAP